MYVPRGSIQLDSHTSVHGPPCLHPNKEWYQYQHRCLVQNCWESRNLVIFCFMSNIDWKEEPKKLVVVSMFCPPSAVGRWKRNHFTTHTQGSEHSHKSIEKGSQLIWRELSFVLWHSQLHSMQSSCEVGDWGHLWQKKSCFVHHGWWWAPFCRL
jgi:hypothetical protein